MKAWVIILLSILTLQINSQNWVTVNPKPQDNFNAIIFFNDLTGIVGGNYGVIYKTSNAGSSWLSINSGTVNTINSFYFLNTLNGFAVGDSGLILETTNSGFSWNTKTSSTVMKIKSMTKTPSGILLSSCNGGVLLRSTDGGNLWTSQVISGFNLNYIFTLDNNNWFACGDSDVVLKSTNAGSNWSRSRIAGNGLSNVFTSLHFFDINTGIALANNKVYHTANGGINWSEGPMFMGGNYTKLIFISPQLGYIMGNNAPLYKSTNSGINWFYLGPQNSYFTSFNDICIMDSTKLFMCGAGGQIVKSTNSGTWLEHLGGVSYYSCYFSFYDVNRGMAVFKNYQMTTTNGGVKWMLRADGNNNWFEPPVIDYRMVEFSSYSNGCIVTHFSQMTSSTEYVSRTSDGGNSFYGGIGGGQYNGVSDIETIENSVIVTGRLLTSLNQQIYRADNGGNWVTQYTAPGNYYLQNISFANSSTGIVAVHTNNAFENFILRTTNSGTSWSEGKLPLVHDVIKAKLLNDGYGYILCDSGKILRSTNYGSNWFVLLGNNSYRFKTINILDRTHFYAVTANNKLAFSSNGGTLWSLHDVMAPGEYLYSVQFLDSNTGYISGDSVILKTTNGGLTFVNMNQSSIPEKFGLSQNYPNPFNPVTIIKFSIPLSRGVSEGRGVFVKLLVYDLLGREITLLVNQQMQPGSYSVDWDAANYPSGVYFYTLVVGDNTNSGGYIETKKMVLVK